MAVGEKSLTISVVRGMTETLKLIQDLETETFELGDSRVGPTVSSVERLWEVQRGFSILGIFGNCDQPVSNLGLPAFGGAWQCRECPLPSTLPDH